MNSTLHTNLALMLTAAPGSAVTSGSVPVQTDERDTWTALDAAVDQNNDAE